MHGIHFLQGVSATLINLKQPVGEFAAQGIKLTLGFGSPGHGVMVNGGDLYLLEHGLLFHLRAFNPQTAVCAGKPKDAHQGQQKESGDRAESKN